MYKTVADDGFSVMSRQTGLYRSIADETLLPLQHVDRALALWFEESSQTPLMSKFTGVSVSATAALPVEDLQRLRRSRLDYWAEVAASLPQVEGEPFQASLIARMDSEIDLFDRGDVRHTQPLQVLALVRDGAEVTGTLHYDDAFDRKPDPALATMTHEALYAMQPQVHAEILNKLRRKVAAGDSEEDLATLWKAVDSEVAAGFAQVHVERPPQSGGLMSFILDLW